MSMTSEHTEVMAGTPELLFGAVKDNVDWVPKLVPHIFPKIEPDEGDDDADRACHYHVHEDKQHVHGGKQKFKVVLENHDPEALPYVVDCQGVYPEYKHLKCHVKMLPGPSPNSTSIKWRIEYVPYDEKTGAPDDLVEFNVVHHLYKDLAAHVEAQNAS